MIQKNVNPLWLSIQQLSTLQQWCLIPEQNQNIVQASQYKKDSMTWDTKIIISEIPSYKNLIHKFNNSYISIKEKVREIKELSLQKFNFDA